MQMISEKYLDAYENRKLLHYNDISQLSDKLINYKDLKDTYSPGLVKYLGYVDGELKVLYSDVPHHAAVIAGTRMGKTTSIIMDNILTCIKQKKKKSMLVTDPKGEVYSLTKEELEKEGYNVILYNLRDPGHTSYWNPLTDIFHMYQNMNNALENVIKLPGDHGDDSYIFNENVYESKEELEEAKSLYENDQLKYVDDELEHFASAVIKMTSKDPYWDIAGRQVVKSILWAMLEDSNEKTKNHASNLDIPTITEDTFSIDTMLRILSIFNAKKYELEDDGYLTKRNENSKAYQLALHNIIDQADTTRQCILCTTTSGLADFNTTPIRAFTTHNSIKMSEIIEKPTVIFITYKDETASSYDVISMIVQNIYKELVNIATSQKDLKLDKPFYFFLDEFGNFPKIENFEKEISASAGRNIYFVLAIQSYAQLNSVYGNDIAEIILDNLNLKYFLGSNHSATIKNFSESCGEYVRISPMSAMSGSGSQIEHYSLETVPLIPKSKRWLPRLAKISEQRCNS